MFCGLWYAAKPFGDDDISFSSNTAKLSKKGPRGRGNKNPLFQQTKFETTRYFELAYSYRSRHPLVPRQLQTEPYFFISSIMKQRQN
jgi:hypothetical protein